MRNCAIVIAYVGPQAQSQMSSCHASFGPRPKSGKQAATIRNDTDSKIHDSFRRARDDLFHTDLMQTPNSRPCFQSSMVSMPHMEVEVQLRMVYFV